MMPLRQLYTRLFTGKTNITNESLRKWNGALAALYGAQGLAILLLSSRYDVPLTVSFLTTDSLQTKLVGRTVTAPATHQLFVVNLAHLVAAFLFIAALAHLLAATAYRARYEAGLRNRVNSLRWIESAVASGIMLTVIGLLVGMYDIGSLLLIFVLAVILNLSALAAETYSQAANRKTTLAGWLWPSISGLAGIAPWLIIALYVLAANAFGSGHGIPRFVYWLYVSLLLVFVGFALNAYLVFAKKGKWAGFAYGERWYMLLGLTAKSLLAWQVFAGLLHP